MSWIVELLSSPEVLAQKKEGNFVINMSGEKTSLTTTCYQRLNLQNKGMESLSNVKKDLVDT